MYGRNCHLISDDYFFTLGMKALFPVSQQHLNVPVYCADNLSMMLKECYSGDLLLLAVECIETVRAISESAIRRGLDVVFIFDIKTYWGSTWQFGYLSKKLSKKAMLQSIGCYIEDRYGSHGVLLTDKQRLVIGMLARGCSPSDVAKELKISIKTVCSHKTTAMQRSGFYSLNSLGVILFDVLVSSCFSLV